MYYLLIPIIAFIFFIRVFTNISVDINHKFKNFDYRYSLFLRANEDLRTYIYDLDRIDLDSDLYDKNYDLKIFPPYSDYNTNQSNGSESKSLELFDRK